MRLTHLLIVPAAALAFSVMGVSAASAGEVTGNGKPTPNDVFGHAQSICSFSGLQDGDEDGDNVPDPGAEFGPGAPPQNWGHVKQFLRAEGVPAEAIAAERPGVTCNGHTGFVAQGGGE